MFKVMIVDDTEVMRRDVKRLRLWGEDSGFIVADEAKDGLDALRKLEANPMDLVITDIRMPKMDGIELLQKISEKKLCPVTVLLSDYTEYHYARQGFLHGAFDYIAKPVDLEELAGLLKRVQKQLDEKKLQELKLQVLQGIAEDALFITGDTEHIIELINNGDPMTASFAASLVDKVNANFNTDRLKIPHVLQNAMHEIIDATLQADEWLELFLDVSALRTTDYSNCKDQEEMKALAVSVLEKLASTVGSFAGPHNNKIVKQACEYALGHIDGDLSVRSLSEKLFINKTYLSEVFKQQTGITLLEYITMIKMERAKKLLQEGGLKTYEIAETLGYKDYEYFSRLFKKYAGALPKDFKE